MVNTVEYLIRTIGLPKGIKDMPDILETFDVERLFSDGSFEANVKKASCITNLLESEFEKVKGKKVGRIAISPIKNRMNRNDTSTFILFNAPRIRPD